MVGESMKPWEEDWFIELDSDNGFAILRRIGDGYGPVAYAPKKERAWLLAAVPMLVRALLEVEFRGVTRGKQACPSCFTYVYATPRHAAACTLDAALTAAGLPTQAERDAARAEMASAAR